MNPPDYQLALNHETGKRSIIDKANSNKLVESFGGTISHEFVKQRLDELWKEELK